MKPLVIFHDNCNDGFTAAWIARGVLPTDTEFFPANYGSDPPDVTGREVYLLDFSYKRPVMLDIASRAKLVTVLDHHKTAEKELEKLSFIDGHPNEETNVYCKFDMTKSGARLTWQHFYGQSGMTAPWLVDYTEDRDLWLWKLPLSKEVNAALSSYPRTFEQWSKWAEFGTVPPVEMKIEGSAILRYQQQTVDSQAANAVEIEMDGYRVLSVNATVLISEIGEKLAKDRPFSATWFARNDGVKVWSLRSRGESGIDVSAIAKAHGGGGHKNAAGFQE